MRWYTKVIRLVQSFFHREIQPIAIKLGKELVDVLKEEGIELVKNLVKDVMDKNLTGDQKKKEVFAELKNCYPNIKDSILNYAIEFFVREIKSR